MELTIALTGKGMQKRYNYLNEEDSKMYDKVKDSKRDADIIIKRLLLDKAYYSRASHASCKY